MINNLQSKNIIPELNAFDTEQIMKDFENNVSRSNIKSSINKCNSEKEKIKKHIDEEKEKLKNEIKLNLKKFKEILPYWEFEYEYLTDNWIDQIENSVLLNSSMDNNDPTFKTIMNNAVIMAVSSTVGIFQIDVIQISKMLADQNVIPKFLLIKEVINLLGFSIACQSSCIEIIKEKTFEIIVKYLIEKIKFKFLIKNEIHISLLNKSFENFDKFPEKQKLMIDKLLNDINFESSIPDIEFNEDNESNLTFEDAALVNEKINENLEIINKEKLDIESKISMIRDLYPNIENEFNSMLTNVYTKLYILCEKTTPDFIKSYSAISKGLNETSKTYSKLLADFASELSTGKKDSKDEEKKEAEPEEDDEKTSDEPKKIKDNEIIKKDDKKQQKNDKKQQKEQAKELNKEQNKESNKEQAKEDESKNTEKTIKQEVIGIKNNLDERRSKLDSLIKEKNKKNKELFNNITKTAQDEINKIGNFIDKAKAKINEQADEFKKVYIYGEHYVDAVNALKQLNKDVKNMMEKLSSRYISLGNLLSSYNNNTIDLYKYLFKNSSGDFILNKMKSELNILLFNSNNNNLKVPEDIMGTISNASEINESDILNMFFKNASEEVIKSFIKNELMKNTVGVMADIEGIIKDVPEMLIKETEETAKELIEILIDPKFGDMKSPLGL